MSVILTTGGGITLAGAGTIAPADWAEALALAPVLVAADGGADAALAAGHMPEAVIGDFDSLSQAAHAAIPAPRLHHVPEQDSTDFEKCLTRIRARFVLAIGFTGRRLDHTLATLSVMTRHRQTPVLLLAEDDLAVLAPPRLDLDLPVGTRFSLWPLGHASGRSTGLHWPIDGIVFQPAGRVGTSNKTTGPVSMTMDGPMLVLLPRDALPGVMAGLGLV